MFYNYIFPGIFLVTVYFVFQVEINGYFNQVNKPQNNGSALYNYLEAGIGAFGFVVQLLYSMVFVIVCIIVNQRWVRNKILASFSATAIALMAAYLAVPRRLVF